MFINLSFAFSVQESLAGEGFEQPLLCAVCLGSAVCWDIRLLRLYRGRQGCKVRRGTGGEAQQSESINQGDAILIASPPVQRHTSCIWAEAGGLMV